MGEAWEGGRPALTPRSLQFAHPRRDLRCARRWRAAGGLMPPSSFAAVTAVTAVTDTESDPLSFNDAAGRGMVSRPKGLFLFYFCVRFAVGRRTRALNVRE